MSKSTTPAVFIIPQTDENVKSISAEIALNALNLAQNALVIAQKSLESANLSANKPLINVDKWTEKQPLKRKIARKFFKIGLKERCERMNNCSNVLEYSFCRECGKVHIKRANLCRDRFCPICSWRLALQRVGEMQRLCDTLRNGYPELSYSLITLTVKNCAVTALSETMSAMSRAWNLTLAQRQLRPRIFGWARSTEITYNRHTHELHPHYHIIMAWLDDSDRESAEEYIKAAWLKAAAKNGLTVDIKAQDARAITDGGDVEVDRVLDATVEVFKYSVKTNDLDALPLAEFRELVEQYAGKHLCEFGGKFKALKKALKLEMEKIEDEDVKIGICRDCGSVGLNEIILRWSFGEAAYKLFSIK